MAIDFPDSPTDGQEFQGYYWDDSKQAWRSQSTNRGSVITSATTPTGATAGDLWFNTVDGTMYVYYDDGITTQWVEVQANVDNYKTPSQNYIINGAFDINQRNFTSNTSNGFGFDRWSSFRVGGTVTYSSQAFSTGSAPVSGYESKNFARIVVSGQSGASDEAAFFQNIEDVRTLAGSTITVSFWAKAASGNPKVAVELGQIFGSGGSATVRTYFGQTTLNTSWARYSVTGVVPGIAGKIIGGSDNFLSVVLFESAGSNLNSRTGSLGIQNNTFDFWGVQVEEGTIATPFRRNQPNIQAELAACQRYYAQVGSLSAVLTNAGFASTDSILASGNFTFPVPTRTSSPTITVFDIGGTSGRMHRQFVGSGGGSNVAVSVTQINQYGFYVTSNIGNTDRAGKYYGYYTVSDEL
jgi:hypothetical protein